MTRSSQLRGTAKNKKKKEMGTKIHKVSPVKKSTASVVQMGKTKTENIGDTISS